MKFSLLWLLLADFRFATKISQKWNIAKNRLNSKISNDFKIDLDVVHRCYRDENISKESQEHISDNISYFRPLPADCGHDLHQQKSQKS